MLVFSDEYPFARVSVIFQFFASFCIGYSATSYPYISTRLIVYSVKKGNLHFKHVIYAFLGKYVIITPKRLKLKILHIIFCLSKKEVFRKLPVQKADWTVLAKSKWPGIIKQKDLMMR